jgi:signal peptidase I
MFFQWLTSPTVRQATALRKQVLKLLDHQRDILAPKAVSEVEGAMAALQQTIADKAPADAIRKQMDTLEKTAESWLKPYPNASIRENVEVLLVALAVAMAIRTFFLQPFKIPTGSMQPTLFGVTSLDLLKHPEVKVPTGLERVREWFEGISYIQVNAKTDGEFDGVTEPIKFLIFNLAQKVVIAGQPHWIFFPPDYGQPPSDGRPPLAMLADLRRGTSYHAGEPVVRLRVQAGDHLFVDRITYNFRAPKRGEIIVFATKGVDGLPQDQFYIKRLTVLGGEKVQIGDDRHLIIDYARLRGSLQFRSERASAAGRFFRARESNHCEHGAAPGPVDCGAEFSRSDLGLRGAAGALHGDGRQYDEQFRFADVGDISRRERDWKIVCGLLAIHEAVWLGLSMSVTIRDVPAGADSGGQMHARLRVQRRRVGAGRAI